MISTFDPMERIAPLAAMLARETGLDGAPRPAVRGVALPIERGGFQWLPVSAHIRERYLVTYRAPAARLAALVPAPLAVDARDGYGFISVCALDIASMGIAGTPAFLRWSHQELLYRVGVRAGGQPSFFTLRSDVSSRVMAALGRFSHYRVRRASFDARRVGGALRLGCTSRDGLADAEFQATPLAAAAPAGSLFSSIEDATAFLIGMKFSVDVTAAGRVRAQDIDHDPWGARFVTPARRRFDYLGHVAQAIGADVEYDHTLAMTNLRQTWRTARWI